MTQPYRYYIVTLDGDIFGCNDEERAKEHSEEDMVIDTTDGTLLGTASAPTKLPVESIDELETGDSPDDSDS